MSSKKLCSLVVIGALHLTLINAQFHRFGSGFGSGFGSSISPFLNAGGSSGGFSNQNTNFQQSQGGSFGAVAAFGSGSSSTNFQQHNQNAGNCY